VERPRWGSGKTVEAVRGGVRRLARLYREAYGGLPRAAWLLALLELVNRCGTMVIFFLTLYMTRKLGFTVVQAGTVMSAYGVGSMVGTYLGGRLCDRLGAYHVQKLSLGVSAVLLVVLRPKGFALHRLAGNLGVSIGPVVGGSLAALDYKWLFWADGLTSLLACGLAFVFLRSAGPHGDAAAPVAAPALPAWRNGAFLRLLPLVFGIGLVFAQFFSTYPLYLRLHYGMAESGVGRLIAVNTLLIVAVEMALMHALRRQAPTRVIAVGTLLLGLGFGLTAFGATVPFAVFSVVVWTFGEILTLPMLLTLTTLRSDPAAMGEYQGLTSLAFAVATTFGPLLATRLWDTAGPEWVWYACAALGVVMALGFARMPGERTTEEAGTGELAA
jgi:predicted MFS family arabinose efflux permease